MNESELHGEILNIMRKPFPHISNRKKISCIISLILTERLIWDLRGYTDGYRAGEEMGARKLAEKLKKHLYKILTSDIIEQAMKELEGGK
jgi:hypothetical protein